MADHSSLPVVELSGSPVERGRQYGEQARPQVTRALSYYEQAFGEATGLTWAETTRRAAGWVEPCRAYAPDLLAEIEGIAEGAGVRMLDILTLNARGEIIYDNTFASGPTDEATSDLDGCSSFALMSEASGDGHVYCGQNWDWRHGVGDTLMILRVVQPPHPTVTMHVEAGQIGRQGANSAGIALNANGLGGRFDATVGVPQTFIRRRVLDSPSLRDALGVLTYTGQHIASNALVTHRDGFAIDMETTPGAHGWMYPTEGLLVHGNHYQAFIPPQLAASYRPGSPDSLYRVPRVEAALARCRESTASGSTRKLIRDAMSDHLGYPKSVCAHPDETAQPVRQSSTLLSSCVDLTTGEYLLTPGPPCEYEYELMPWNIYDGPGGGAT